MEQPRETPASVESPLADPIASAPAADGVDVTLIRWMLAMTPEERLRTLQSMVRSLTRLA